MPTLKNDKFRKNILKERYSTLALIAESSGINNKSSNQFDRTRQSQNTTTIDLDHSIIKQSGFISKGTNPESIFSKKKSSYK